MPGKEQISTLDSKRRLTLPKGIVEKYGRKFVLVRLPGKLLLEPLPEDPLRALQAEGRKLKKVTLEQFEEEVEEYVRERV